MANYRSPIDPIIQELERGDIDAEEAISRLMGLGDLRKDMYYSNGRCKHLGPYPGCRGGCNLS